MNRQTANDEIHAAVKFIDDWLPSKVSSISDIRRTFRDIGINSTVVNLVLDYLPKVYVAKCSCFDDAKSGFSAKFRCEI